MGYGGDMWSDDAFDRRQRGSVWSLWRVWSFKHEPMVATQHVFDYFVFDYFVFDDFDPSTNLTLLLF